MTQKSIIRLSTETVIDIHGVTVMLIFLKSNGLKIECTNEELADFGLGLANGSYDEKYAQKWINDHFNSQKSLVCAFFLD